MQQCFNSIAAASPFEQDIQSPPRQTTKLSREPVILCSLPSLQLWPKHRSGPPRSRHHSCSQPLATSCSSPSVFSDPCTVFLPPISAMVRAPDHNSAHALFLLD
ncbi:hypothetical protein M0R45_030710 [Rubus argutus]|uniref:Uncharacterized protein n=1 Tax=Rubus argutus TaxID=59490 RepID=A0AAW1WBG3_RUBAR